MGGKAVKWLLCLLALLCLTASALAEGSVVVIPESATDIPMEAYAHDTVITDLYLPASLETVMGMELDGNWSFGLVYGGNNWHPQEYKLVLHAPEGTVAAEFARRSGLPYVIEDARGGTDRAAVAAWVQAALDEAYPGAKVCRNCAGSSAAGRWFAFPVSVRQGRRDTVAALGQPGYALRCCAAYHGDRCRPADHRGTAAGECDAIG